MRARLTLSRACRPMSMRVLAEASHSDLLRRGRAVRAAWLVLGLMLVAIGSIGIFVPLLPTTDFLLLALPCFARSSRRLENWLLNHPRFGPGLRARRKEKAVPRRAKDRSMYGHGSWVRAFLDPRQTRPASIRGDHVLHAVLGELDRSST